MTQADISKAFIAAGRAVYSDRSYSAALLAMDDDIQTAQRAGKRISRKRAMVLLTDIYLTETDELRAAAGIANA